MHALDILGEPVRRRIVEILGDGERPAGAIVDLVGGEFGISQPAVSRHLRILREHGFVAVKAQGTRRLYAIEAAPLQEVEAWLAPLRRFWEPSEPPAASPESSPR